MKKMIKLMWEVFIQPYRNTYEILFENDAHKIHKLK
jgi:PHP family Zn ribbon phosphoesterase